MNNSKKICFMFPGQGSQKIGMGIDLYKNHPQVKEIFNIASQIFNCDLEKIWMRGPTRELVKTINAQPIITVFNAALFSIITDSIKADCVAGHSLGEVSALYAAGVLSIEDLFLLVKHRSESMEESSKENKGVMYALLGITINEVKELIDRDNNIIDIANHNTPDQVVISGEENIVSSFLQKTITHNNSVKSVQLKVSGAWHSSLMKHGKELYKEKIKNIQFKKPIVPIFTNVTGEICEDPETLKKLAVEQFVSTVKWVDIINGLHSFGITHYVTVGVDKILKGLFTSIMKEKPDYANYTCYSIENITAYKKMLTNLQN